jgi:hypothetical protein
MEEEYAALLANQTWDLVPSPPGSNVVYGLHLHRSPSTELVVYTDADWAGCPDTRRSTSGYAVFLGGNLVSWSSKRQPVVSHSSAEAEYRAVANGVAEASWLR